MKEKIKKAIFWAMSLSPVLSFAAGIKTNAVILFLNIFGILIWFCIVVGFVFFLWGIIRFITSGGDEEKRKSAKRLIIYGLIGISVFVMIAVRGIIKMAR